MESGNERQNLSESSGVDSNFPALHSNTKSRDKDSVVGPFGDSPNKSDRQRKKLLNWLKETQQKRDENNKRIFSRWLGMVEKGNLPTEASPQALTSSKPENSPTKTDYTPKIHSIPYDAFYTMTPVYYTYPTPEYWMLGPDQNVAYYNNYNQRTPCLCYPYCYQTPATTLSPCEMQMTATGPVQPPPPPPPPPPPLPSSSATTMGVMSNEGHCKQEPLQFNLNEWYTALEDVESDGGQAIDNLPIDPQQGQPTMEYSTLTAINSVAVAYSASSLVSGASSVQPGDFS